MSAASQSAIAPSIAFDATDGTHWIVREFPGGSPMSKGSGACLIFECDGVVRRVRTFPHDWRDLETAALIALSWGH